MNGDACVSRHVRLETTPYHRKAGNDMGNDMDKKGILTVRMMGTISVEYEGEFFPVGTALTGKILQLLLILLYAGKKGVGREELLDVFYGNGEYANPSGSLRAAVFRLRRLLKEMLPEHEYICTDGGIYRWDEGNVTVSIFCTRICCGYNHSFVEYSFYERGWGFCNISLWNYFI